MFHFIFILSYLYHIFLKDVDVSCAKNDLDFKTLRYELKDNEINKIIIFYRKDSRTRSRKSNE